MSRGRLGTVDKESGALLTFGDHRLDLRAEQLWEGDRPVWLRPKLWAVLRYLVGNPGRLIPRDELLDAVWPGVTLNEEAVARHVRDLRRALGDDGRDRRYIEVLYGRGFRFVVEVHPLAREAPAAAALDVAASGNGLREAWLALGLLPGDGEEGLSPLVGRERELATLEQSLARVSGGIARLVEIAGEAGVGKTRLAAAAAERAIGRGARVVVARCHEGEGHPPFWPWVQTLRGLVRQVSVATARTWLGPRAGSLAQLLPEVGVADAPSEQDLEQARIGLFDAVLALLHGAACDRPLLVILDDIHWADPTSVALLQAVLHGMPGRVLILATRRAGEPAAPGLERLIGRLRREGRGESLRLEGLDSDGTAKLIASLSGGTVEPELARELCRRTSGNPYFVAELWRHLGAGKATSGLPESIRATLDLSLERLPDPARELLSAAAVQGVEFEVEAAAAAAGIAGETALTLLERAAPLVVELPDRLGWFRFGHALAAESITDGLSRTRRARLSQAIGEWIERHDVPARRTAEIAYHLVRGLEPAIAEKALIYCWRAGREATSASGYEAAAVHYERALEVLATIEDAAQPSARRCEILLELAEAHELAGDGANATARLVTAGELARLLGDATAMTRTVLGVGTGWQFAEPQLVRLLEDTLERISEAAVRARLLARLAQALYLSPDSRTRRETLASEALELARASGDPGVLGFVLTDCLLALYHADNLTEQEALAGTLYAAAAVAGDLRLQLEAHAWRIVLSIQRGRLTDAAQENLRLSSLAAQSHRAHFLALSHTFAAALRLARGDLEAAEEEARAAARINQRFHPYHSDWIAFMQLFTIRREQGRSFELQSDDQTIRPPEAGEGGVRAFEQAARWQAPFALSEQGQLEPARRIFRELMRDIDQLPPQNGRNSRLASLASLVDVCAAIDDAEAGRELLPLVEPYADQWVVIGFGAVCAASVHNLLGMLHGTLGHHAEAERHFEQALAEHDREQAVVAQARTLHNYARMLLRHGSREAKERALRAIDRGLEIADRHGLAASKQKLERLAAASTRSRRTST